MAVCATNLHIRHAETDYFRITDRKPRITLHPHLIKQGTTISECPIGTDMSLEEELG